MAKHAAQALPKKAISEKFLCVKSLKDNFII